ncbi:MAG TPA: hypothetical protein VMV99_12535 [Rhodanobacter sp.]|nr:hypothetical protein [Rhodanobacter sp.]
MSMTALPGTTRWPRFGTWAFESGRGIDSQRDTATNQLRNWRVWRFSLVLLLAICICAPVFAEESAIGEGHARLPFAAQRIELDHGRPWPTDASLREGMERIRVAVERAGARTDGRLTGKQSRALTVAIQQNVVFIVSHCRLQAKADANLHILLGRLLEAENLPQIVDVLDLYPHYFFHPGWLPGADVRIGANEQQADPHRAAMQTNPGEYDSP